MKREAKLLPNQPEEFRLKRYYYAIEITSLIAIFFFGFVMYFYKEYFPWVRYPLLNFLNFIYIFVFHALFFFLHERYKRKIFYTIDRYLFIPFFLLAIYAMGGVLSTVSFVLIFPLLVSAVDLDAEATKKIGIIVTTLFALLIFADPPYVLDPLIIIRHGVHVSLFALISYYMYKIVKETLRQKYEKEEATRKLIELTELDRLKNDFLTVAEHQLRTPLAGARWGLDNVLQDSALQGEILETVKTSLKKVESAIGIVNEMLKTAELGMQSFKLAHVPIDLGVLVENIFTELDYLAQKKSVSVKFKKENRFLVKGDETLLRSALVNIIDNAIRYSPRGTVEVSLSEKNGQCELVVKDNGIGVKETDFPYIFERFYRGKEAIALDPNESGVGLYITKKIIELHRGTVVVVSKPGEGTTVKVSLPSADK